MDFNKLMPGMLLRSETRPISYLIYEKTSNHVYMIDVTSKRKYMPWDKVNKYEWEGRMYPELVISKNRFDMHNAVIAIFELVSKMEK